MLTADEFESRFRAADKASFILAPPEVRRVVVITDLGRSGGGVDGPFRQAGGTHQSFLEAVRSDLRVLGEDVEWFEIGDEDYDSVQGMVNLIAERKPDLVVAYRNLKDMSWQWPYSLGCFLNVLTRETEYPVLIVPNPNEVPSLDWREAGTKNVMVVTDHLAGDSPLVNWGVRMTEDRGRLWLTHVEDDAVFERYMTVISKVPTIPTDEARESILKQLLREPQDYIESTRTALQKAGVPIDVEPVIKVGHQVRDYLSLLEEHDVDLLCFHTNSDDQVALHGATYLLAVQLRALPILML